MTKRGKKPDPSPQTAPVHQLETLEQRKMLTTLVGGDTFRYIDVDNQVVDITVTGDAIIELIGTRDITPGDANEHALIAIGDLGGEFVISPTRGINTAVHLPFDSSRFRFGADGTRLIGPTTVFNPITGGVNVGTNALPSANVTLQSLATDPAGATFSINVRTVTVNNAQTRLVELLSVNTATGATTVIAELQGQLPVDGTGLSTVNAIRGAAIDPTSTNDLYFVAGINVNNQDIDTLYSVDVTTGTVTGPIGTFGQGANSTLRVDALHFDQVDATDPLQDPTGRRLLALVTRFNGLAPDTQAIEEINPLDSLTTATIATLTNTNLGDILNLTGLAIFGADDPLQTQNDFLAVQSGAGDIFRIDASAGVVLTNLGPGRDLSDNNPAFRGNDLQSLSFHPNLVDPFTGQNGAYIATDASTDELVYVNALGHGNNQLFGIYVSHASPGSSITISTRQFVLPLNATNSWLTPFTGVSALSPQNANTALVTTTPGYDLQVTTLNTPLPNSIINFDAGIGGVYIGHKDFVLRTPTSPTTEPLLPITDLDLLTQIGVLPLGIEQTPDDGVGEHDPSDPIQPNSNPTKIRSGVVVSASLTDYLDGTQDLGPTSITDTVVPQGTFAFDEAGSDSINLNALASRTNGETYSFNVVDVVNAADETQRLVQFLGLTTIGPNRGDANVIADLNDALIAAVDAALPAGRDFVVQVNDVRAAAFDPDNPAMLYFVAEMDESGVLVDRLFAMDVTAPDVAASLTLVAGTFGQVNNASDADPHHIDYAVDRVRVQSLVFDQNTSATTRLLVLLDSLDDNGSVAGQAIIDVNPADTDFRANGDALALTGADFVVDPNGNSILTMTGIAPLEDNASVADTQILAISSNGNSSQYYHVNLEKTIPEATSIGLSVDTNDHQGPVRGLDLQGLAFNPALTNPFDGTLGAFIATDATTDELVFVNPVKGLATSVGDRLIQGNVDLGAGLAIRRDLTRPDSFLVLDVDQVNDRGGIVTTILNTNPLDTAPADQIAFIDPATGQVFMHAEVFFDDTGGASGFNLPLRDALGFAYGDLDFDGNEQLYAVYGIDHDADPTTPDQLVLGTIGTEPDLVPIDLTASGLGGSLPGSFSPETMALSTDKSSILFVENTGLGDLDLYSSSNSGGAGFRGTIYQSDAPGSFVKMATVDEIVFDPNRLDPADDPLVLLVAPSAITGNRVLYTLNTTGADLDFDLNFNDLEAVSDNGQGGEIELTEGGVAITDEIVAMAFSADGTLFAVRDNAGTHQLITIDTATGEVATLGDIEVGGSAATVDGLTFDRFGRLFAYNRAAGTDNLIIIDPADPTNSVAYNTAGSASTTLFGLETDANGRFISFDLNLGGDSVFVSSNTVEFTPVDPLGTGGVLDPLLQTAGVSSIAFAPFASPNIAGPPAQQAMYLIGNDGRIYEVDATDGSVVADADLFTDREDFPGNLDQTPFTLRSMSFDRFGQTLVVHDQTNGRVMDIDLFDAQGLNASNALVTGITTTLGAGAVAVGEVLKTEKGSVRPTVGGLAYNFTRDQFMVVDNATGDDLLLSQQGVLAEAGADESAVIMTLRGIATDTDQSQHFGDFLIGGKVTGHVDLYGSANTFYAGSILTGATAGTTFGAVTIPGNFNVEGDLHNLISASSLGTNQTTVNTANGNPTLPNYMTHFDMTIGGQLGQVWALNSFVGTATINNLDSALFFTDPTAPTTEHEGRQTVTGANPTQRSISAAFSALKLYDGGSTYFNDTFDTAQRLGTLRSFDPDGVAFASVTGNVEASNTPNDLVDYYAVSLMAGQTVDVLINNPNVGVGVFDPDGRLIATNYGITGFFDSTTPLRFTADRPGEYRFAVAAINNTNFNTTQDADEANIPRGDQAYTLTIQGVEELGLGAIRTTNNLLGAGAQAFTVFDGDLGVLNAGGLLLMNTGTSGGIIQTQNGDLRALIGSEISTIFQNAVVGTPILVVPNGGVGLLQSTAGRVTFNSVDPLTGAAAIDDYIQVIDAAATLSGSMYTNKGIGVIRAGTITGADNGQSPTFIRLNTDGVGADGIIDLIDVNGNLGGAAEGGPAITTGPGGNVRYMIVDGAIFQDNQFASGSFAPQTLDPGQAFEHVDDSGGRVVLRPGTAGIGLAGALTINQYGIRGSGGSVLVSVTSSDFGFTASSLNTPNNGTVEIGTINVDGLGRAVTDQNGQLILGQGTDISVVLNGPVVVDVMTINGNGLTQINNATGGEMVSINATSIGNLFGKGDIGLPMTHSGAVVNRRDNVLTAYPFDNQKFGVNVTGSVIQARSWKSLGNLSIGGTLGSLLANADEVNRTDSPQGLLAPVFVQGDIQRVNIGEVLAPSGSGSFSHGGLYANGAIQLVLNQGSGSDILGDIVSTQQIDRIQLTHGSIINSTVNVLQLLSMSAKTDRTEATAGFIDTIVLNGSGGIIGSEFEASTFTGNVTVNGFGIFHSVFATSGNGQLNHVTAGGFGLVGVSLLADSTIGDVVATGNGKLLAVADFSGSVSPSTRFAHDPRFDQPLTVLNDLALALASNRRYEMVAGQINGTTAQATVEMDNLRAHKIVDSTFDFANEISTITTGKSVDDDPATIDNVQVTTGKLGRFNPGADVRTLTMTIAGPLNSLTLRGNLLGDSLVQAVGPNGNINTINILGDLVGSLFADGIIRNVTVGGDMTGDIEARGVGLTRGLVVSRITIKGSFFGSADLTGDVGQIIVTGQFGRVGDELVVDGNLNTLRVGNSSGGVLTVLAADVYVSGDLRTLDVIGQVHGLLFVGGNLSNMKVTNVAFTIPTTHDVFAVDPSSTGVLRTFSYDAAGMGTLFASPFVGSQPLFPADPRPLSTVGALTPDPADLSVAAVDPTTRDTYRIDTIGGVDTLVMIDAITGALSVVGELRNTFAFANDRYSQDVFALTIDELGRLIALVGDRDGAGADPSEAALVEIDRVAVGGVVEVHKIGDPSAKGVLLDGGGVLDPFVGFGVYNNLASPSDPLNGRLYAIRRTGGVTDELVLIDPITGAVTAATSDLRGMAIHPVTGEVYAVDTIDGTDKLIVIDPATGGFTVVGEMQNKVGGASDTYSQNLLAMAFDGLGQLIALVSDRDGSGADAAEVALVEIDIEAVGGVVAVHAVGDTTMKGVALDGGGVVDAFTGLAVFNDPNDPNNLAGLNGTIVANRRTGGATDDLVAINPTTGAVTAIGSAEVLGGGAGVTNIIGVGFDPEGNLIAQTNDGVTSQLLRLNAADLDLANGFAAADTTQFHALGDNLIHDAVTIGGELGRATFTGGDLGDGRTTILFTVGGNVKSATLTGGDLAAGFTLQSLLGDITKFDLRGGDLNGVLQALAGDVVSVTITGSDLNGTISGVSGKSIRIPGMVNSGAVINFTHGLGSLTVGDSVAASADIDLGYLNTLSVTNDFAGDLNVGYNSRGTRATIGGDWMVATDSLIDAKLTLSVGGDLMSQALGDTLHVGRDIVRSTVGGTTTVNLVGEGNGGTMSFAGPIVGSVITFAQGAKSFSATSIDNSLIQFGVSDGDDDVFAPTPTGNDANEATRIAHVSRFTAASMTNSVYASGGNTDTFTSGTMDNSSAMFGYVHGPSAINAVVNDATPLADATEVNAARSAADAAVYLGSSRSVSITGGGLTNGSFISAGTDAGAAGDFVAPAVATSMTGGMSTISRLSGAIDGTSGVFSDTTIKSNSATGAGVVDDAVTYTLANITTDLGSPLPALVGSAVSGTPFVYAAEGATITLTGKPGESVDIYDAVPGDGVIDAIVFNGTTKSSRVTVTGGGAVNIGRLLSTDDSTVSSFVFDGDIVGDGTDAPDIWVDGPVKTFTFDDLGGNLSGQIGGEVSSLTLDDQGPGRLVIGGPVKRATINTGSATPLLSNLGTYANTVYNTLTVDGAGIFWAHAGGGVLDNIDPTLDGPGGVLGTVNVVDGYTGNAADLLGMDFNGADLFAAARLYDPSPTRKVGGDIGVGVQLSGLAVNSAGEVYAIDASTGVDQLVRFDNTTGTFTVIGALRNTFPVASFSSHVDSIAFDQFDRLIAIISDVDGNAAIGNAGDRAIAEIETVPDGGGDLLVHRLSSDALQGVLLDDGGVVTDAFTGLAVQPGTGTIYGLRRVGGTTDQLVTINSATGAVTVIGNVQINGGGAGSTSIKGIGFDADGNLLAMHSDGATFQMLFLDQADLADASLFQEVTDQALANATYNALDAFAVGSTGTNFRTFAYDTAGNGMFFTNPVDTADATGRVAVLGTVDTVTGAFSRLLTLSDDTGQPAIVAASDNLPFTADTAANDILFIMPAAGGGSQLVNYDVATGTFAAGVPVVDSAGDPITVDALEYDGVAMELIAFDNAGRNVVQIDPGTGVITVLTTQSVLSSNVTGLTFDDGGTGEFFTFETAANPAANRFAQLVDTDEANSGGIIATHVDSLTINGVYQGRFVTTGNTFKRVTLNDDFFGVLASAGDLSSLTQRTGDFGGVLEIQGNGRSVTLTNNVLDGAMLHFGGELSTYSQRTGDFAGHMRLGSNRTTTVGGDVLATGELHLGMAGSATFGGAFGGTLDMNGASNLRFTGTLGATARATVHGDAKRVDLASHTDAGSVLRITGTAGNVGIKGTHAGALIVGNALTNATFNHVLGGQVIVTSGGRNLRVSGTSNDALFAYGIDAGADGLFNTADDLIYGGYLGSATFGLFTDSVLTVGVLPALGEGPGLPADHNVFLRRQVGDRIINTVEAGGVASSKIGRLNITEVDTSAPTRQSVVVTTQGVGRTNIRTNPFRLEMQEHPDPFLAPTVEIQEGVEVPVFDPVRNENQFDLDQNGGLNVTFESPNRLRLVLTEPVNSDSVRLSQAIDPANGIPTDNGTVAVMQFVDTDNNFLDDSYTLVDNVTLEYGEVLTTDGRTLGFIDIVRPAPFNQLPVEELDDAVVMFDVVLVGDATDPIVDRSGHRSALTTIGDPAGTALLNGVNARFAFTIPAAT